MRGLRGNNRRTTQSNVGGGNLNAVGLQLADSRLALFTGSTGWYCKFKDRSK